MYFCASMQGHLRRHQNEWMCVLSPGSVWCLRTERDQRKDNSGRATESCNPMQHLPENLLWPTPLLSTLGKHKCANFNESQMMAIWSTRSAQTKGGGFGFGRGFGCFIKWTSLIYTHRNPCIRGFGKHWVCSCVCFDAGRHPSTFTLFVTSPVSTPSHMVHHKEELLVQIQKDFKNSGGILSDSDGTPTDSDS